MADYTHVGLGLPPLHGARANALILGSFPSPKSREQGFFYGHKQNRFWPMIAAVTGEPTPDWADIEAKKAIILRHGLAVWDTIGGCDIKGASDASIRNAEPNDVAALIEKLGVQAVFCNGAASGRIYAKYAEPLTHLPATVLPSTSPANAAWSLARLEKTWGDALAPFCGQTVATRANLSYNKDVSIVRYVHDNSGRCLHEQMAGKTKRPVLPIYMAALVWPIMALLLPIYTLGGLIVTAVLSAAAYFAGTRFCPTRVVRVPVAYATGSEDVDAMLNGIAENLDVLHKLNEAIPDPQLSAAMTRMERAGRSIAAVVEKTPDKARSIDRFARYYLPEIVKLMSTYAALEQNGVKGENADQITAELRRNAETTATAFENQLDALYSAEAMDISTDIEVLDSILKSQNLAK